MAYKIIVAHPGRQHSFRLASALKKNGDLLYYCTTIYDKDSSLLMKIVKKFLSRDNLKRANSRKNKDLDDKDIIQFCEFGGMIEAFLSRVDKNHNLYRTVQKMDADKFGIKVAKLAIREKADAVVMYDSNASEAFAYLEKYAPDIVRILDTSIAVRPYMKEIYQKEIKISEHDDLRRENSYMWEDKKMLPIKKEIDYSHYFLAASNFVKESLKYCGVQDEQIKIVPYGANVDSNVRRTSTDNENRKLEFLFVGQVIYRKGISYLIESMQQFGTTANLTITGAYDADNWFVQKGMAEENISFTGLVTIDRMKEIYEQSDVFVIPSFAEGMAQVGIEAMACGLPIICTFNSGVADLVTDGINGFIIEPGNKEQLVEKMQWFVLHKDQIAKMGNAARRVAQSYTWEAYNKNVITAIHDMIKNNSLKTDN